MAAADDAKTLIELRNVSKTFLLESGRALKVLDGIDLLVKEGEVVALLGPSGSGKSTCLRIMCGLHDASSGDVVANGHPLVGINPDVALVFQSFALFPWETVHRNIAIGLESLHLTEDASRARVKETIDLVGLEGFEEAYPRELSGGMKQRVGLARALAMQRPILFLDEPFSALDVLTAETLKDEIMRIFLSRKTSTRAMLVVTHNISEAVFMADRILVMGSNPGRVRAEIKNGLPQPRDPESKGFKDLVMQIHALITETLMPDMPKAQAATSVRGPRGARPEALPQVSLLDVVGLIEAIDAEGGDSDIFELSTRVGKDFGQTLYLLKAAELLNLVDTPKQMVLLTPEGRRFAAADINLRKQMLNQSFGKLEITQMITELLRQSEAVRLPLEYLVERVHEWLPNEHAEEVVRTLIGWGRYAEYFGYNDDTKSVYLDVGQETV